MEMNWIGYLLAGGIVYASLGLIGMSLLVAWQIFRNCDRQKGEGDGRPVDSRERAAAEP